jgi:hypothetical protein
MILTTSVALLTAVAAATVSIDRVAWLQGCWAHPSGQPSAVFRARDIGDQRVVFENPEHDFPQRVGYERKGADALAAWIEGTMNGRARRVDFAYRRVACP